MLAKIVAGGAIALALAFPARGALITFDEVLKDPANLGVRVSQLGPVEFGDLECDPTCERTGALVMDISALYGDIDLSASGPMGALVSDYTDIRLTSGGTFNFTSAYFGMTHPFETRSIVVTGLRDGVQVYSQSLFPTQSAERVDFGWRNVDRVEFDVRFGTGYLTIDDIDLRVNQVPEPGTGALAAIAALFLGACAVRTRRSTALK